MEDSYYDVLGLATDAGQEDIEHCYQDLVSRMPPDSDGDSVLARYLREAYEILRDPQLRAAYDRSRGLGPPPAAPPVAPARDDSNLVAYLQKEAQRRQTRRYLGCVIACVPIIFFIILFLAMLGK